MVNNILHLCLCLCLLLSHGTLPNQLRLYADLAVTMKAHTACIYIATRWDLRYLKWLKESGNVSSKRKRKYTTRNFRGAPSSSLSWTSCSSSFARTVVRALSVRFPTFDVMSGRVHTSFRALPALRHVLHRQVLSSVDRAQLLFRSTLD